VPETIAVPAKFNIGSGKDFKSDHVNLDYSGYWSPDIVADLSDKALIGSVHETDRFGALELKPAMFDEIICNDVIEHVSDVVSAMTNCLNILRENGKLKIIVPYDLSYGAWQDPTHLRAFNERSWLYYTDWHWYIGWTEARFNQTKLMMNCSQLGVQLLNDGIDEKVIWRTPRAIDSMSVVLEKHMLTESEKLAAKQWTSR
jgi:predicted SAM-dependent methyltransferase